MVGILVQLAISWLLAWLFVKKGLGVLGLYPTRKRLVQFVLFFTITALCCASGFIIKMVFAHQAWIINPALNSKLVLEGAWWNIKSVLFEELIFRGVILYILIRKIGSTKAIIISAIAFGIYHWFSMNAFGNITQMTFLFFATGIMGLLLAFAYAKTLSLYIPIAIHLGWNFTQNFIFSSGPTGNGFFIQEIPSPFRTDSYLIFFLILLIPMISVFIINFFLLKSVKQVQENASNNFHQVPVTNE
jgi:membrane protease YdiL (CAAX protease family)